MREKRELTLKSGRELEFTLDRGKRKNLYIQIRDGEVLVKAPLRFPEGQIYDFVLDREDWIFKSLSRSRTSPKRLVSCSDGEEFALLGKIFALKYSYPERRREPYLEENTLVVSVNRNMPDIALIKRDAEGFINELANRELKESCERLIKLTGLCPKKITVKKMTSCWGRCSSGGNISLNFYLIEQTKEQMDYVVLHELCHLVHMDHSDRFWALVARYCPEWKRIRRELNYDE